MLTKALYDYISKTFNTVSDKHFCERQCSTEPQMKTVTFNRYVSAFIAFSIEYQIFICKCLSIQC